MNYRTLGRTGLRVSELCFGTMTFGGEGIYKTIGTTEQAEADRLVGLCIDAGINFFDTADTYSMGRSEQILGKALGARRKDVVVATKVRGRVGPGPNAVGLSRGHIMDGIDASLRRLGTDYVDLYQIHGFDALTPWDETLRALDDLVRAGKVRYLGASNLAAWQLMKALGLSEREQLARFETIQSYYSLAGRDLEREVGAAPALGGRGPCSCGARSPVASSAASSRATRPSPARRAARSSTSRPSTRRGAGPRSTRWRRSGASKAPRWRGSPCRGCCTSRSRRASSSARATWTSCATTWPRPRSSSRPEQLARLDKASALPPEYPGWMVTIQQRDRLEAISPESRFAPTK